jgi:Ternary complex associated domain 2/Caspase domain
MAFSNGHALVIGVGNYIEHGLQDPLPLINGVAITVSDAQGVADALKNPAVCAYPAGQVTFLPPEQTTKQGMIAALKKLAADTGKDDTVVIFFCGHGSLGDDGEYYFGTRDVKLAGSVFKGGTGLGKKEFLDLLRQIDAQKLLLIINACFSGNIGGTLAPQAPAVGAPPPSDLKVEVLGTGEGRAIITASRANQYSRFDTQAANTYFGQALIDTLQGKGMPTGPFIGLFELYDAVFNKVKQASTPFNPIQEPMLTIVDQVGPFPVALSGHGALGTLGPDAGIQQSPPKGAAVEQISKAEVIKMSQKNTGHGGINISGGNVSAGGDMVGGDKIVHGDEVHGDKFTGDKVMGDKMGDNSTKVGNISGGEGFNFGTITGDGTVLGSGTSNVNKGVSGADLAAIFRTIYKDIDEIQDDSVDKDVVKATVKGIEKEASKGEDANPKFLEKAFRTLAAMSEDIFDVTVATLANPISGIATVVQKIAAKAKADAGQ